MDEVFGFAPPTKEPPSKQPILTSLKQARAHGVGMVLSPQNPVDLDYKAMANAGTWMVGRLQTENDKKRILEGLASASGEVDIGEIDKQISDLGKRQFVLHSTKATTPRLFTSRWAMSYLAGPLTRDQVGTLMEGRQTDAPSAAGAPKAPKTQAPAGSPAGPTEAVPTAAPDVADDVPVSFLAPSASWAPLVGASPSSTSYVPAAAATVQLLYDETKAGISHRETYEAIIFPLDGIVDTGDVVTVDHDERDFLETPPSGATFAAPEAPIHTKTFWKGVATDLENHLVSERPLEIFANAGLGVYSRVEESEAEFRERCRVAAETAADAELAKLKDGYQSKIDRIKEQMTAAQTRYQEADAVAAAKSEENLLGTAGDLLGAFLGGRSGSTALKKTASRQTAVAKAEAKAESEAAKYHSKHGELVDLENELATDVETIVNSFEEMAGNVERLAVTLEKNDIRVVEIRLLWIPV
jgi:hypothetical protein